MIENTGTTEQQQERVAKNPQITFYDILRLIFSNWYWFLISMVICGAIALFYLRSTPPIYQRTATVMVKDTRKGGSAEFTVFSDIMGGMGRNSVDNEVYIFGSRHIMETVVDKFDLATRYSITKDIRTRDIYGNEPILVKFITADKRTSGRFKYTIQENGKVRLYDFFTKEETEEQDKAFTVTAMPGDTVTTPLGDIALIATPFAENFVDTEVQVVRVRHNEITEFYRRSVNCNIASKMASIIQ